jgi:sugar phosphate isomerase/epimerase
MDIVELLENLNVEWHQEPIINLAADEIVRLREEVDHLHKMTIEWSKLHMEDVKEIRRLREALREIHGLGDTPDDSWKAYQICCKALGEDE